MDKKELKNLVEENFDAAIFNGTCEFSDRIPDIEGVTFVAQSSIAGGLLHVELKWKSGYMVLYAKNFTRSQMVSKFTEFLWMYLNS